ncbi:ethanolaminephosphotransferase 1 [Stomoxys calcitrans]|uniref:Ethanolaminephosphotransferase 1 n=1 Tax=Stomoxys calcitrans TaxID=35570 RepID=A0A1I8PXM5_STOCA|nr:ethanolaminephosphotransferase 1 [Stomoxys calcitrans]XP_013114242.1 ethanolaminephosphotransferase 1 [Stomoxys calcitrans]XP_013114243.1 ethanolaminephosphotransferase 1 [Stomoxys calcitrans]XP_013114244.1 ethanolaminephosphotransferase 1 [Stomoxys calcitrans]XP_013114245.1 ethanolaminephosphotransferase 1 [Stomoxys calcitrans]XP_013114246.1 ethanolaminephosphotransferase 1 [Stomoxys calcitrans]XP_013114249.1 ethanolaminephosphotransferase 1 [Stomoxys calcitrans]XP_059220580.1 ethanolami
MLGVKYLTEAHLKGFEKYKYSSIDTSYLSVYVMHPFWNKCVEFLPMWLAPNILTFVGFLMTVINFLLLAYYDWDFAAANPAENTVPRWVWSVAALNIMLYYNLDGMDGKQARRTGTSGPLGELFDHGLDSYSAVLIPIYMFSLFGTDDLPPYRMFFVIWNVFLNFYLTHVEKYNTGVMFLPWGYDFTMWGVSITLFLTTIVGPGIWRYRLETYNISMANIFEVILIGSGIVTSHPIILKNIYMSYKNKTGKMRPFLEAARPMFAFLWLFFITTIWVLFSRNNVINLEPRIMFILFGTLFSNIACRLIVSQMSDTRCDGFNILMWPLVATVGVSCFPWYKQVMGSEIDATVERLLVQGLTIFVTVAHLHYGQGVVREMCSHFKIRCFKIVKPEPAEQEMETPEEIV